MKYARIAGIGSYLPEKVVSNKDLEETMDTSDEWIRERTGIKRRHIVADNEFTVWRLRVGPCKMPASALKTST
jgi:3-oxoacyl-[acyl-carrier-protein] synthase-3